jgi:hypothetical protein
MSENTDTQGFVVCAVCSQHHPAGIGGHRSLLGEWCAGGTVARLRALLGKATPGEWFIGDVTGEVLTDESSVGATDWQDHDTELAVALRNAASVLLDIVEAAQEVSRVVVPSCSCLDLPRDSCCFCGAYEQAVAIGALDKAVATLEMLP